jgi:tRNA 2-thiocytidine biosynthesis protein TtcA
MLSGWDRTHPGRVDNIGRSINNVTLSHLGDRKLFDFAGLKADSTRIDALQID